MGTNYYLEKKRPPACPHCGLQPEADERLHIGKSSYGWKFSLHIIPEEDITCLEDWKCCFADQFYIIVDENGVRLSAEEMLEIILERGPKFGGRWGKTLHSHELGPYCVANFETYDLIPGDFS